MPITVHWYDQQHEREHGLGRHIEHDSRSREHEFKATRPVQDKTTIWSIQSQPLDQGQVGSCTGEAPTQLVNTDFFTPVRKKVVGGRYLNQDDAYNWYHLNTTLDSIPGTWQPDDTGSSGIAAAKAGIKQGFFDHYKHAFGWNGFKVAIQHQPLIIGIPWAVEMDDLPPTSVVNVPDFSRISPNDIGGHELLSNGIDFENKLVVCFQSWGNWGNLHGVVGQFGIPFAAFQYLLAQGGDVVVPHGVGLP